MTLPGDASNDLTSERITALLEPGVRLARPCHVKDETGSTNDDARALAHEDAPHGTVVIADSQRSGRGRQGRPWHSPPGRNIHFSLLLRPPLEPARMAGLTLAMAVAVAEVLESVLPEPGAVVLRWPNDVLIGGRKVAGLLMELETTSAPTHRVAHLIVGIGVNVNITRRELPDDLADIATSLRDARIGKRVDRAELLARLLERLEARYEEFVAHGLALCRDEWRRRSDVLGRAVTIVAEGPEPLEAFAEDIDDDGALLVRIGSEQRRIVAGEVKVRPSS